MNDDIDSREVWNFAIAEALIGKILLVGITYLNEQGEVIEQQQFFGRVCSAHPHQGILLALQGQREGEHYTLPPDTRSIVEAVPGEYRLYSTGEIVVNPNFTATFTSPT